MADVLADGMTAVWFVPGTPGIADRAAPKAAEISAGMPLQHRITADGLVGFEASTAEVDNTSLASTFDTKTIGRASYSGTLLRLKKQSGETDAPYDTLERGVSGDIVIRRGVPEAQPVAADDKVEVYPGICGESRLLPPEANSIQKYEVPVMITDKPELRAVVAAGA